MIKDLVQELIFPFINESTEQGIGLLAGGMKPPTKGHYELVLNAAKQPEISKLIVYIGNGVRDGITAEQSKKIWELYNLPSNVEIKIAPDPSPITSMYHYFKANQNQTMYFVVGIRNEKDEAESQKRIKHAVDKYKNVHFLPVKTPHSTVSGTKAREYLKNGDYDNFFDKLPDGLSEETKEQILNILDHKPIQENKDKIPGGLAKGKTLEDIAKHHDKKGYYHVDDMVKYLKQQLKKGIKVEMEHTTDFKIAREIAMDHLWEDPNYYNKLGKIEKLDENTTPRKQLVKEFIKFTARVLDLKTLPKTYITKDKSKTTTYAHNDIQNDVVVVYSGNRSLGDILRSLGHEYYHYKQKQTGELDKYDNPGETGSPIENEANAKAGVLLREFGKLYPQIFE